MGSDRDIQEPTSKEPMCNSSACHRSSFIKLSLPSSRSRLTLVGCEAELDLKLDTAYGTTYKAKELTWLDNLLGVFCSCRRGRFTWTPPAMLTEPGEDAGHYPSPWILPVYVLSTQRDESRHFIPKEAKCTIDTANLQGNLVSKTFATEVLGYAESSFQRLTPIEEAGGIGVTGHKLIPQGAISLTWYYSNSTRVFRDMRFLISEHPMYDLIIGSQAIHQNRILDVPNFMNTGITMFDEKKDAGNLEKLRDEMNDAIKKLEPVEKQVLLKKSKDPNVLERYKTLKEEVQAAEQKFNHENRRLALDRIYTSERKNHNKKDVKLRREFELEFGEPVPPAPTMNSQSGGSLHSKPHED